MEHSGELIRSQHKSFVTGKRLGFLALIVVSIAAGAAMLVVDPIMVFAGIFGAAGVIAVLVVPYLGVLAYFVFEYASVSQMFPALQALQVGKLIIVGTLGVWVIQSMIKQRLKFVSDPMIWVLFLWVIAALISNVYAVMPGEAVQGTIDIIKWLVIFLMIVNIVDSLPKWQGTMWIFLLLAFKMSQFQIRAYGVGLSSAYDANHFIREGLGSGYSAFFGNAGDFGVFMCVVVPLAFYLFKAVDSKILKGIALVFLVFFIMSIFKSGARGNTVGLFAVMGVFWWRSKHKIPVGAIAVLLAITYWMTAPDIVRQRFMSTTSSDNLDDTSTHRLQLWGAGLQMFVEHPLTGVGIYNYGHHYVKYYMVPGEERLATAPHNIFIQGIAELGILGISALFLSIIMVFMRNRQTRELLRDHHRKNKWIEAFTRGLDLSLVGYLVAGSFLTVLYYPHLFMILSLTVSLHHVARKRVEEGLDKIEEEESESAGEAETPVLDISK